MILLFLTFTTTVHGQQVITYSSDDKPLAVVLDSVSRLYDVNFAFDPQVFSSIKADIDIRDLPLSEFLEILEKVYSVRSKNMDGTWVLTLQKKADVPVAITPVKSRISGYVTDKTTGEKLLYCNVAVGGNRGGVTNEMGYFSIELPDVDSVSLKISHLAYQYFDTIVKTNQTLQIQLDPHEIMIDPIRVTHYEKQVLQASPEPGVIAFNPAKSSDIPRVASDDLANALLIIPGISFMQGAVSGISVRGSIPADNLVLFDGIPVLETSHLLGNMSVLNSKFVHQAFVSRGGFDVEYGGRVAGLIRVIGKSGKNNHRYLDLSANMLNTNVMLNMPVTEKFSVTAAWRRSFIDTWQNYFYARLIENQNAENPEFSSINPMIRYQDLNTKLSFHPSEQLEVNLNLLYGADLQSRDFTLFSTDEYYRYESTESDNFGVGFNMNWQPGIRWFHSLSAGYSSFDKNVVDETGELQEVTEIIENPSSGKGKGKGLLKTREKTYEKQVFDIDDGFNHLQEMRASWKSRYRNGRFDHTAGVEWTANSFRYDFVTIKPQGTVPVDSINNAASLYLLNAFYQQDINLFDKIQFKWGARVNSDLSTGRLYWQPRGTIEANLSENIDLYYQSGLYYQFFSGARRFDSENRYSYIWHLANNGENVVKSYHHIAGFRFQKQGWYIDLEGWHKNTSGRLNLFATNVDSGNGAVIIYTPETSDERSMGADLFIQKKYRSFNHMVSYSWSKIRERFVNRYNSEWFPGFSERPHQLKIVEMVSWKKWVLTTSWNLASGLPVINVTNTGQMMDSFRTDYFSQLDVAVVKHFKLPHADIDAGVSFLNILDRRNVIEVSYLQFSSTQESLTVRSDVSALGFAPVFFINLKIR